MSILSKKIINQLKADLRADVATKILVVDDEPDFKLLVTQFFRNKIQKDHLHFLFTNNTQEALRILNEDPDISIVLTNLNAPGTALTEFLEKIALLDQFCKVIVISAYGDMVNVRMAMNRGAFDFIMKPIDFSDLGLTIDRLIEQSILSKEAQETKKALADIERQLDIARTIQQSFIPHHFNPMPHIKSFEIFGKMLPAKHVGGDFFDFFPLDETHLGFIIADVSGKGVPAALFMAVTRTIIRTIAMKTESPLETVQETNKLLNYENETSLFVTAFYGIINSKTGELRYSNAGHNPPYLLSSDQTVTEIGKYQGLPLGVLSEPELSSKLPYSEKSLFLKKNDTLILYTDGVTEAMNLSYKMFGEKRLNKIVRSLAQKPLQEIVNSILKSIKQHGGSAAQSDDCTLLALRYKG
ncbi:Response regulator receiver modulated serine phosphatase [Chlamydiales bacterium STE3]|nr:Response regulator receiver modulated serine phosphatase [Chlamydiales bacterium STE3]